LLAETKGSAEALIGSEWEDGQLPSMLDWQSKAEERYKISSHQISENIGQQIF
jgi:hypothetical protein